MLVAMDTIARKRVLDVDAEWELVKGLLPIGWQEKAKQLGAVRRLRGIDSVELLLRILLVHLADGCSLKETALRVCQAGLGKISSVGIFKRLRAAGPWLAWMAVALRGEKRPVAAGRHCVAVDATTVCEHGEVRQFQAWVKGHEGRWHRGRLVAVKRSLAATRREIRRRRKATKSRDRKLSKCARKLASYLMVWTSLPAREMGPRQVVRGYRLRWQLERVFKRAKSIMGLGQLPKYCDASSQAWLNGKLLVAMLVEKLWQYADHFSPWGYDLPEPA
jgi:hypothetical protein